MSRPLFAVLLVGVPVLLTPLHDQQKFTQLLYVDWEILRYILFVRWSVVPRYTFWVALLAPCPKGLVASVLSNNGRSQLPTFSQFCLG